MSADVVSVVLEFIPGVESLFKMRLVSRLFDTATFRISPVKLRQVQAKKAVFYREVEAFDDNLVLENLLMHLETLEKRRRKLLKNLNTGQALCEFYSYGEPPDYIHYIGEALGEATSFIRQQTGVSSQ